jgi:hypothetical protein
MADNNDPARAGRRRIIERLREALAEAGELISPQEYERQEAFVEGRLSLEELRQRREFEFG